MIGLALSGGGSRAIAFHLGCLRALEDLRLLENVSVLSTISGGSVIGAYYAYNPHLTFPEFEKNVRSLLRKGFQTRIASELAKPHNLILCFSSFILSHIQDCMARLTKAKPIPRYFSRTELFKKVLKNHVFPKQKLSYPTRNSIQIVIGSCELRTGTAFRFGNTRSGSWRQGEMLESDVDVAFAVAASAAFPMLLPALDRKFLFRKNGKDRRERVFLTDGGVYDNLGVQVLEPGRDPSVSLHTFPCEYVISCNAGQGQESGQALPIAFVSRVWRSFEVIHRRVQESAMHRLHQLKQDGSIKGFALPYLGQQDSRLPWRPSGLITRNEVIDYPTDFCSMSEEWIDRLSGRGEQLTRLLVNHYLRDLVK